MRESCRSEVPEGVCDAGRRARSRSARGHTARAVALIVASAVFAGCGMPAPTTPLTIAAERGDVKEVGALMAAGADPNGMDDSGLTPLVRASRRGHLAVVRTLLTAGADANRRDAVRTRDGWTPLMNAVHKGHLHVVEALIESGADVNAASARGTTALMLATCERGTEIVEALLAAGADPRPGSGGSAALTGAVASGQTENVRALLRERPDLHVEPGLNGRAALLFARIRGRDEILRLLDAGRGKKPARAGGP